MKNLLKCLLFFCYHSILLGANPSTTITSDRMEMLRFKDHNEFTFCGKVQIHSKNFYGECEHMWVYTHSDTKSKAIPLNFWFYGKNFQNLKIQPWTYLTSVNSKSNEQVPTNEPIGQIKKIVAKQHVFLEAQDTETGELKRAYSEKADIFPGEGKMVLTENPVVRSSTQGTFRGGKITFYKNSGRIIVENQDSTQRSQVLLSE